jgi:hypothetical protein
MKQIEFLAPGDMAELFPGGFERRVLPGLGHSFILKHQTNSTR